MSVPADSAAGEVPFHLAGMNGAAIIVPVYIDGGGPYDFILDTGATLTCIDRALADSLDLPAVRGVVGVGAGVGGSGALRLVRVDSLRVGSARARGVMACVVDLAQFQKLGASAHGLLGLNVLKEFRVTLDFRRHVLGLTAP